MAYNTIAFCKPVGHPSYTVIEHSCDTSIYSFPCDSLCVVTDEDMEYDRSLTMKPDNQPQAMTWRNLANPAFLAGVSPKPPNRGNHFDRRNDSYFAADGPRPVAPSVVGTPSTIIPFVPAVMAPNIPGRVTEGGARTAVVGSMIMVNLPPISSNGPVVYDNYIGLTGKRPNGPVAGPRFDTCLWNQIDAITACYRNTLDSALVGFVPPLEVIQPAELDDWALAPSTDVSFPPIGYSTNKTVDGLRYHSTAIADGGISAVVDWFDPTNLVRGNKDPAGNITNITWMIRKDVVLRSAFYTYFRYHVEQLGHDPLALGVQIPITR